jgi:RNA polymerase sigma factor (sigma-70 family)
VAAELEAASRRRFRVPDDARSDVLQDLAVLALRNADRFETLESFRGWARARLHWLLLDYVMARREATLQGGAVEESSVPAMQEARAMLHEITRLITRLPERQQAVMDGLLRGQSAARIAGELGITEATVRSLQRFGRQKLVEMLEGDER